MSLTALDLSVEDLSKYKPLDAIRLRNRKMSSELSKRRRQAMVTAREVARLLRSEFGAKRIYIFGSLALRGSFSLWSDIDIAVEGIQPERFFEAVGVVTGISTQFKIDLLDLGDCMPTFRARVESEGKVL